MTKDQLITLEDLLEQFSEDHGDDISNDRYSALVIMRETVTSMIVNKHD